MLKIEVIYHLSENAGLILGCEIRFKSVLE